MNATEALQAIIDNVEQTLSTVDGFPHIRESGTAEWQTTPYGDWCGGSWIGLLWLAAKHASTSEEYDRYINEGHRYVDSMGKEMPTETMFYGLNHFHAGFRGYDVVGDRTLYGLGLRGADAMIEFYNDDARQIPLGIFGIRGPENFRGPESEHGPSGARVGAVDNVYTALPVLWRAYRETNDSRFRDIAVSHADRHLDWYIREDGSTWHHAVFDLTTGSLEYQYNELAYSDDTCWARGQGWCIAGLSRAYRETGAERYLHALEVTTDYYVENSPDDLIAPWDFETPEDPHLRDTSAAALTAYGLVQLDGTSDRLTDLRETGTLILESIVDEYLVTDPTDDQYGGVLHGCYNKPGEYATDHELIWTNYYTAYALDKLVSE